MVQKRKSAVREGSRNQQKRPIDRIATVKTQKRSNKRWDGCAVVAKGVKKKDRNLGKKSHPTKG